MSPRTPGFNASNTGIRLEASFRGGAWSELRWNEEPLSLSPMALGLHYGQSIFEGFKALRQEDGSVALFRPEDHLIRFGRTAARMCMPEPPREALLEGILELVRERADLVPDAPGFLYLRPLMFSDEAGLAPVPSEEFHLLVVALPVDPLFRQEGVRLTTVPEHVRAAPGGTGACKCAGNYAASMAGTRRAKDLGYDEVLWLDAMERRWVEETGSMNVMYVRDGRLCTPPLGGTILPGITRDTLLRLGRDLEIDAAEAPLAIDEDWSAVTEVFSSGTAAGTTHIRSVMHGGEVLFERDRPGPVASAIGEAYEDLLRGRRPAPTGWRVSV